MSVAYALASEVVQPELDLDWFYTDEFGYLFPTKAMHDEWVAYPVPIIEGWRQAILEHGPPRGWVYFIEAEGTDLVKIGSSADPRRRLYQLQTGSGHRLRLIGAMPTPTPSGTEAFVHRRFRYNRVRPDGEWFTARSSLRRYIADWATVPLAWL